MVFKWALSLMLISFVLSGCVPAGQAKADKSKNAEVHYKLAIAHLQGNNPTMALKELLNAVQSDPDNSAIHVALAQAYQQKKAYALAERHYLKALELEPGEPRYQNNLGALYLDMKEWDKAITYFDKAGQNLLFLNVHVAVAGKAYAYFKKDDYANALKYYQEAAALAPRYASAHFRQSEVYRKLNKPELEKAALLRAIDIAPQFLQARYRLAEVLVGMDEQEQAEKQLQTIIEFAPTSDWGLRAVELLRSIPPS